LMTLLTFVNLQVAYGFQSNAPDKSDYHKKKQIPCITSMLTRLIYFTPKELKPTIKPLMAMSSEKSSGTSGPTIKPL